MSSRTQATSQASFAALRQRFHGQIIGPDDAGYDDARRVWNHMIDRRPACIARCASVDDVVAAVNFGREQRLPIAVRGGGHSVAGLGTVDDGIVIDLSLMRRVDVDPEARIAHVQGGATLADVDHATQQYNLVTPTGNVSETGIAGLTLSGGLSHIRRKFGMSVDNLLAVEIVTAGGRRLRASTDENPDLYWGVRGGGGNFGIVTSFEFQLHELGPEVAMVVMIYPEAMGREVMRTWRDWSRVAPDEFCPDFLFWNIPAAPPFPEPLHGTPVAIASAMYAGPAEEGLRLAPQFPELGEPLINMTGIMPYLAVQSLFDPFFTKQLRQHYYWKSLYLDDLSDEAIDIFVDHALARPSPKTLVTMRTLGGAISAIPNDATPVANREAKYLFSADASWADPADDKANISWMRKFWGDMHAVSDGGVYLNFAGLNEEGDALTQSAHRANQARLAEIKRRYDPDNLFRINHNIKPAP